MCLLLKYGLFLNVSVLDTLSFYSNEYQCDFFSHTLSSIHFDKCIKIYICKGLHKLMLKKKKPQDHLVDFHRECIIPNSIENVLFLITNLLKNIQIGMHDLMLLFIFNTGRRKYSKYMYFVMFMKMYILQQSTVVSVTGLGTGVLCTSLDS